MSAFSFLALSGPSKKAVQAIHPASLPIEQLLRQCQIQTGRRSGPGGQHRNKVETAVVIKHLPTGITAQASERRSQATNREEAVQRLRLSLAVQVRTTNDTRTNGPALECEPSALSSAFQWSSRINKGKIQVSQDHEDYPAVIAGLLDDLQAKNWNLSELAEQFQTSSSQVIKLLRTHPPALEVLNQNRIQLGLPKLS